jgi:hypothetical protein
MKRKLLFVVMVSMVLLTSCAKFPLEEFEITKLSVQSAKVAGADVYVPEAYKALVDSLQKTEITLASEKAKWFKTYKTSKLSLTGVNNLAIEVKAKSKAKESEVIKENETLIISLTELVATDKELLSKAPKGKDGKEALAAITTEVSVVETSISESKTLISSNDLLGANAKLKASKEKATSIKTELESAISKVKSHKK